MTLVQITDSNFNVLLATQNFWTLGNSFTQLPGNTSVFYTVPGSETLISATVVTTSGQPVYAGPSGASATPTRITLPPVAGQGGVNIAVNTDKLQYVNAVSALPGTVLVLNSTLQQWTLVQATTCYYLRTSNYGYAKWDGSAGFGVVAASQDASVFEYLNGTLYVHGTFNVSSRVAVAVVSNGSTVTAQSVSVTNTSTYLASIQSNGSLTLGSSQFLSSTDTGTLTLCPVASPSKLCTMQLVPTVMSPLLGDLICYLWPTSMPGFAWPLPPLAPSGPPLLTPTQSRAVGIACAAVAAFVIISCLIVFGMKRPKNWDPVPDNT